MLRFVARGSLVVEWQDEASRLQALRAPASLAVAVNPLTGAASRAAADNKLGIR